MSLYQRYFRVTTGPLMDEVIKIEADNERNRKSVLAFAEELGAKNMFSYSDGSISGFEFDKTPDQSVWKQPNSFGHYMPRKNTAGGKEMIKRIKEMPRLLGIGTALNTVGLEDRVPVLIEGRSGHCATLFGKATLGVLFVGVPWRDIYPDEIEKYRREREAGTSWSMSLEHLLWVPTPEMQEIKRWEMEKEVEELNARLRATAKQKQEVPA